MGTSVSITFTDQKWNDALKKTGELAGTDWWWKVDESGQYWLKAKPSSPTHTFTIRRDIVSLNAPKDAEKVINDVQVRRSGGTATNYSDATSQSTYGTGGTPSGKWSEIINDSSLTDANAADQRGNKEINDNKDYKIKATAIINSSYDIESVKVGQTAQILNFRSANTFFGTNNLLIVGVEYRGDTIKVDFGEQTADLGLSLAEFVG